MYKKNGLNGSGMNAFGQGPGFREPLWALLDMNLLMEQSNPEQESLETRAFAASSVVASGVLGRVYSAVTQRHYRRPG